MGSHQRQVKVVQTSPGDDLLAHDIVGEACIIQLETDQHLETRGTDRGSHQRIGHGIDQRVGIARLPLTGQARDDLGRRGGGGACNIRPDNALGAGAQLAVGPVELDRCQLLRHQHIAALDQADKDRQHLLACRQATAGSLPAQRRDLVADLGHQNLGALVAGGLEIDQLGGEVDRIGVAALRRIKAGERSHMRWNGRGGTGRAGDLQGVLLAGGQQGDGKNCSGWP